MVDAGGLADGAALRLRIKEKIPLGSSRESHRVPVSVLGNSTGGEEGYSFGADGRAQAVASLLMVVRCCVVGWGAWTGPLCSVALLLRM